MKNLKQLLTEAKSSQMLNDNQSDALLALAKKQQEVKNNRLLSDPIMVIGTLTLSAGFLFTAWHHWLPRTHEIIVFGIIAIIGLCHFLGLYLTQKNIHNQSSLAFILSAPYFLLFLASSS